VPARDRELVHLGRCLALARAFAALSQEAAAQQLGVSRKTVSLWETGVHEPGARDLMRMAEIYKVGLDTLCGRAGLPVLPLLPQSGTAIPRAPTDAL
jgi:transcriptional regulator with XRE-family HTH domain